MKKQKALGVVLILILLYGINESRAEDIDLTKIVVTPSRIEDSYDDTSRKVDVITSKAIKSSGASNLAQALTDLTSVNMSDYGGLGQSKTIRMRGSTAAQVLVMVDGRPVNSPRDGEIDLSTIPLDNIERVEIMHGAASNLYGSGAMGGTVNIITKNPPKEKQKTELITSFATYRTYIERLSHGARVGKLGYIINGSYESSAGFRKNSEYNSKDWNAKFEYTPNDYNTFRLNSGFYNGFNGSPGSLSSPDNDDKQKNLKNFLDLNWGFKPDPTIEIATKIYENYDRLEFMENSAGSMYDTAFNKDIHTTKVRGLDFQASKRVSEFYQGLCGFNYVDNFNDSTTSAKHKYIVRASYLENKFSLFERLDINLGARYDDYSNFGGRFNPSAGFFFKFNENYKLRGSISRSFRAPTFNDLYWPDQGWTKGNPNLRPERGTTGEIGLESKITKRIASSLTYYRSKYTNLINWEEEAGVWTPKNINSALIDGIESESSVYLTDNWEVGINYTFLKAKDKTDHTFLIYQPKNKADAHIKFKGSKGLLFEIKGQFTDTRFHDAQNTIKVKRFFTIGLNASKKFGKNFTYFMSIDNLLNKKYQVIHDYPMPRFSITNGMKLEF